ncbi:MAG TPA: hypothetical protein VE621_19205, partial [Bryobacteraceae bacterium]|nr:hypothetical protein [Bryobacteraceae bacterium]
MTILVLAFVIFSAALFAAGYYVWQVPQQQTEQLLVARLRELRRNSGLRTRLSGDLIKQEKRGIFADLGDFVQWIGVLRRLQEHIDQANLKYRAADVFSLSLILAVLTFLLGTLFIPMLLIRVLLAAAIGFVPVAYINWVR